MVNLARTVASDKIGALYLLGLEISWYPLPDFGHRCSRTSSKDGPAAVAKVSELLSKICTGFGHSRRCFAILII